MPAQYKRSGEPADEVDVVVVGSGAGGLTTALVAAHGGLSVVVVEKTKWIGGTSAISGGGLWIPASREMLASGQRDSSAAAANYLRALLGNRYDPQRIDAFLEDAPKAAALIRDLTGLALVPNGQTDYEPQLPGAALSRSMLSNDFDGGKLGDWLNKIRPVVPQLRAPFGLPIGVMDIQPLLGAHRSLASFWKVLKLYMRHAYDVARFGRTSRMVNGNALVAALLGGALRLGARVFTQTPAIGLLQSRRKVIGVSIRHEDQVRTISARIGVVLATGGFGADRTLIDELMPMPDVLRSFAPEGNTGDGIRMAGEVGGAFARGSSASAIWTPMSARKRGDGTEFLFPHIMMDRFMPGTIMVDRSGRRFANEATHYQGLGTAMNEQNIKSCFLICDAKSLRRYGLGMAYPGPWSRKKLLREGYLKQGQSLADLAGKLGIDPAVLATTVAAFNADAEKGTDSAFHRGESEYSRGLGDRLHKPNPNLGPLEVAPFFAIEIYPGMLSTMRGLMTDKHGQVLDDGGQPISGLYAAGIDMNSPWEGAYPGGGASLGPAITFAYRTGKALTARTEASRRHFNLNAVLGKRRVEYGASER